MSFVMLFLLILSPVAQDQPLPALPLSVEQAVELAWRQNPTLQALARDTEVARGQTWMDSALPDTELGLDVAGLNFPGTGTVEQETSLGLVQAIPFPGKLKLRARVGRVTEEEAGLRLERARLRLASEVRKAYYRSLLQQKTVEILLKNLELLAEIQKNAISRYALSAVPYSDILRVKLETARVRNDLLEAKKELTLSRQELTRLLGLKDDRELLLTSSLEPAPADWPLEEALARKKELSPTLRLARLRRDRAELLIRLAERNRLPDFSFGLFSPSKKLGATGFSLGLSYPLFSRKRLAGEKTLAEAERQKAGFEIQAAESFFESRCRQAAAEIIQSREQVRIFEESLLQDSGAELEKALEDYRLGKIDSLGLLDLYRGFSLVRLEYYRAIYLQRAALAEFEAAGEDYE
ncbi:MAG: TolC family protein [Candidatus Saccharicenans sp.]|jgi:outer membrane protein TolC|nr:TolC family protein [Candidatus Saccharicenans sp.]